MKTSIIICMHGNLATEILNTIELIIGTQKNIKAINFLSNENIDNIIKKYKNYIKKYCNNKNIIFFVDILGGSPYNAANRLLNYKKNIIAEIISGTNIPMLLETIMSRNTNTSINKLIKIALNNGIKGIKSTNFNINKNKKK